MIYTEKPNIFFTTVVSSFHNNANRTQLNLAPDYLEY